MFAEFDIAKDRYISGKVIKTLPSLTKSECAVSCVSNPSCLLVNYKKDGSSCELLSSVDADEVTDNLWDVLATDSTSNQIVGVFKKFFFINVLF